MTSTEVSTGTVTFVEAVRAALRQAMLENDRVVLLGEDVGNLGGVFRASDGLKEEFGPHRVIDTPMAELSIVGMSIGMALRGLRPIAEIQFADFIWAAADQIFSEAPKIHFRTNGEWSVPLVIRAPWGAGIHGALYHSQSIEAPLCHFPGLKVVAASSARDAAGLLLSAIDDPNPVIVLEHKLAYRRVSGTLAEPIERTPIGPLAVEREGTDVTVVAYGWMVHEAVAAADRLAAAGGPSVEVLDLRTLLPLDRDALAEHAARTGRVLVVHEASRTMGLGAEIAASITEACFDELHAPVARLTMPDVPGIPFTSTLEAALIPNEHTIEREILSLANAPRRASTAASSTESSGRSVPQASMTMPVDITDVGDASDLAALFVPAAAAALVDNPEANGAPDVVIAIVEPGGAGSARRIIPSADQYSVRGIRRILDAQRDGEPVATARPTFTLVVAGEGAMFGFPLVPDGQLAVVQVGAPVDEVVASDESSFGVRRRVWLGISADHRVMDGAASARFLNVMREHVERSG
jgi:2-oxoisovalerate dehydrogenase E1 component beta subunit